MLIYVRLLLARLMGQYCFARWHLSSVGVCNAAGRRAVSGAWAVGHCQAGRVDGQAADTARKARMVTSHYGDTLYFL